MKHLTKVINLFLALLMVLTTLPFTPAAANNSVPTYQAQKTGVTSQDGNWEYDIVLGKNEEPRVWITRYLPVNKTTFTVPSVIDDMRVQSIELSVPLLNKNITEIVFEENIERIAGAFSRLNNVKLVFPASLLMIDENTFSYSKNLTLCFPEGLCGIGEKAFANCSFAENTDIIFPESLICIGNGAFDNTNITTVTLGAKTDFNTFKFSQTLGVYDDSVPVYPCMPFSNCSQLNTIIIDQNNPHFKTENGAIYTADQKELVFLNTHMPNFAIPDFVEYICCGAFINKTFESLFIPSSIINFNELIFSGSKIGTLRFANDCSYTYIGSELFTNCKIDVLTIPKSVQRIDTKAFRDCAIKELYFEEGSNLNEIGIYAFQNNQITTLDLTNCRLLSNVGNGAFGTNKQLVYVNMTDIPLETLPSNLFSLCSKLKECKLSRFTKIIGPEVFMWDKTLEQINLSDIAKCDSYAFEGCDKINLSDYILSTGTTADGFVYNEFENHISLIGYTGEETNLILPDTINEKPVTDIVWHANQLSIRQSIQTLSLPSHLVFIGSNAFLYKSVMHINAFPATLRYIGAYAFSGSSFESIQLNDGLQYVLDYAFQYCPLANLSIPDSVVYYSGGMYQTENTIRFGKNVRNIQQTLDCPTAKYRAKNIYISPENPYYCYENSVLYNKNKTVIYRSYPYYNTDDAAENYQIPTTVESIEPEAFYAYEQIGALVIPANVKKIGKKAFCSSGVTSVYFADGFQTETLDSVFANCKNLHTATFGNVNIQNLLFTFARSGLENADIPDSVKNITGAYDMTHLSNVTALNLPEGLTVLDRYAFADSGLAVRHLRIPNGVSKIGYAAFASCKYLESIDFGNVTFLARLAFENCISLRSIDLSNIQYIPQHYRNGTFYGCKNLKITYMHSEDAYTINACANQYNEAIETVVIGTNVDSIKSKAFGDCRNLETALIAETVEKIADDAFENCTKLTIICTENSPAMAYAVRNHIPCKAFKICPVPVQEYTGKAIKPSLCVQFGQDVLTAQKDYTVSYTNNIQPGTARASVVGLGDYSIYAGTVKFSIVHHHRYTAHTIRAGATSIGYTLYTCVLCPDSYKDSFTAPTGELKLKCVARTAAAQTIQWNNVKSATGYQVQISTKDGKKWSAYATLKAGVTKYTFKKLAAGNAYKFRVRFFIKGGGKNHFSPWSKTLHSPTLPSGTTFSKLTAGKKSFTAQWKKAGFSGYQLQYATNANFKNSKTLTVKKAITLKATIRHLAVKKYYVRIRTYKTIAQVHYFSTWSRIYQVKTK